MDKDKRNVLSVFAIAVAREMHSLYAIADRVLKGAQKFLMKMRRWRNIFGRFWKIKK